MLLWDFSGNLSLYHYTGKEFYCLRLVLWDFGRFYYIPWTILIWVLFPLCLGVFVTVIGRFASIRMDVCYYCIWASFWSAFKLKMQTLCLQNAFQSLHIQFSPWRSAFNWHCKISWQSERKFWVPLPSFCLLGSECYW